MVDVAEQKARIGAVHDEPQIEADAGRPEVAVLRFIDAVELKAGLRGVHLEIERGGLDGFLFVAGEAREAVGESVGDAEFDKRGW
jgi:hypothetical protein